MATRKNPKSRRPVEVKPYEPRPRSPRQRKSLLLTGPNAAAVRMQIEEALSPQDVLDEKALLRFDEEARTIVRRMVRNPSARDVPYLREAVSALRVFNDPESAILLSELLSGGEQDPVLVGSAADAMVRLGGAEAARMIVRALDHSDRYARDRAALALCKLGHPDSIESLAEIAAGNPSEYLRSKANGALERLSAKPTRSRYRRGAKIARKDRIARER